MVRKQSIVILCLLFVQSYGFGQGENNFWFFGINAGVDFSSGAPVAITGPLSTNEGTAVMSDAAGNLLFYTDGSTVWDKTNTPMPNGTDLLGHISSTQTAIIVPLPESESLYYIFTTPDGVALTDDGFNYSIVDMSENGGLGKVISKNLFLTNNVCEKVAAIQRCDGSYWVLTHKFGSNAFFVYPLTASGVGTPVVSNVGSVIAGVNHRKKGELKFSPRGDKLAMAYPFGGRVEVFDFNKNTGMVSNPTQLPGVFGGHFYGISFSPDNTKLYATTNNTASDTTKIIQYDMNATDIQKSAFLLFSELGANGGLNKSWGSPQIGPDGKVYIVRNFSEYLGVINNPNLQGNACDFVELGFLLGDNKGKIGLPNFVIPNTSPLGTNVELVKCEEDSTILDAGNPGAEYSWSTGDTTRTVVVNASGRYTVKIESDACIYTDTFNVSLNSQEFNTAREGNLCEGSEVLLDASVTNATYLWQDGSTNSTLTVSQKGTYWVEIENTCGTVSDTIEVDYKGCDCIFYAPSAFTPNKDGINDGFSAAPSCETFDYELIVYNRWGQEIYKTNNPEASWDGKYKGKELPVSVYVYSVSYRGTAAGADTKHYGRVSLMR